MKVRSPLAVSVLACGLLAPSVAYAGQEVRYSSASSASSWNFSGGVTMSTGVKVKDTAGDSHAVYAQFSHIRKVYSSDRESPVMRLDNKGGNGKTSTAGPYHYHLVVKHRAGVDVQWAPDRLGAWAFPKQRY